MHGRRTLGLSYKDAGVDIEAGNKLVDTIKPLAAATSRPGTMDTLGGFGASFDPRAAGYDDPILVSATDGVGTKLKLAFEMERYDSIGIDLVAMCVNDLVVQGAEPLFFLDYFATGGLETTVAAEVIKGVSHGCETAGCSLIGGETAEMPGLYAKGEFDLAGFSVGAMERGTGLPNPEQPVGVGDAIIGLASTGVHSNGYSLVRKVVEASGLSLRDTAPFDSTCNLGTSLLTPTRIYVSSCLEAVKSGDVHALAHITGGGLLENIPRVLPEGLGVKLDGTAWTAPPVFAWLQDQGGVNDTEMARTFNCGIGMVVIVNVDRVDAVIANLASSGETAYRIGQITEGSNSSVQIDNLQAALRQG
jgi:phosphoribosylformylglycinamidine cyclo-ligase